MSEIVKLNVDQYGLQENKAEEIKRMYLPMIEMLEVMEERFNEIVSKPITKELVPEAKRLRLDIAQVRIKGNKAREEGKAESLRIGKAVQGGYNTLLYVVQSKENKLKDIEDYFENLEKERIEKLSLERETELEKYGIDVMPQGLGLMSDEIWSNFLVGTKTNFEAKKEAERKAEEERIEEERVEKLSNERYMNLIVYSDYFNEEDKELILTNKLGDVSETIYNALHQDLKLKKEEYEKEQEKIRLENERLKKEADEKEKKRIANEKENQRLAGIEAKKQAKIQAENEAKLKTEREAREKAEEEIEKAKADQKRKEQAEKERIAKEESDKKKLAKQKSLQPDKEKFNSYINDLRTVKFPEITSEEISNHAKGFLSEMKLLVDKYKL